MLFIIIYLTWFPFGSLTSISTTRLPLDEVNALRDISTKLGNNWDFEVDPCSGESNWVTPPPFPDSVPKGYNNNVSCSCEPNNTICHVVSISLKAQNLPGTLPPEFVNLRYLQNIDLARNFLSGTIPPEWGSMEQLLNISLLGNRLTGSIPKELGNITTLTTLSIESNLLSGRIPEELGNLLRIERLFLSSNYFTGELPGSFQNLITLKDFRISGNNFSGKIPNFIGGWTSLQSLRIQGSGLEGPIPSSITLLANLSDLRISDLRGPDTVCPPFSNTTFFKNLILRSCNLIGGLPESLASRDLKVLDFSFNKLNGSIPERLSDLQETDFVYLTGNLLSGDVPDWMLTSGKRIDLSLNNFTFQSSREKDCQMRETNLFGFSSSNNPSERISCLGHYVCPRNLSSLYINCGGKGLRDGNKEYQEDPDTGAASHFYKSTMWVFSNTGHFLDDSRRDTYILTNTSMLLVNNSELYINARSSPISLTYYGFCMLNGSYNVSLHFAEIIFTDNETYSSLGRRVFNIYIQGMLVEKDFNIEDEAGGVGKEIVKTYCANVTSTLEIRLYWAGKGTTEIPFRGVYGPIISAISVDPNFLVPQQDGYLSKNGRGMSVRIATGIVVGAVCGIVLVLGVLWWLGCLRHHEFMKLVGIAAGQGLAGPRLPPTRMGQTWELDGLELNTSSFTLRQIKAATNNFDVVNKIGQGGFGSVYKGVLPDGTLIAVKQLSAKSRQGNREFLNELGVISAVQHPHLVKLHGCCIERNQLLLVYEYMENNSLARALFGPEEWQLELDWPTRYKICIGVARGLTYLHEESRLKIVHRDIKSTNVLLDNNLNAKISDFGLAKLDEEDDTHISTRIAGTYGYMAPEYALRGYLTDKADVYSFGIVLLEIVSGMANVVDKTKENRFVLLDRALALNNTDNWMDLVDPRLGLEYDVKEAMVVINISLLCTTTSPTNRPTMSSVVSMLEGRKITQTFVGEQSFTMTEYHEKMKKQPENMNESQTEKISIPYTDSSTSAVDLYPMDPFSEYLHKRDT